MVTHGASSFEPKSNTAHNIVTPPRTPEINRFTSEENEPKKVTEAQTTACHIIEIPITTTGTNGDQCQAVYSAKQGRP
jgi:hypothetical protein